MTTDRFAELLGQWKEAGVVGAIALLLVYGLMANVSRSLEALTETLNAHSSETAYYMRAICINAADTPQKLANCQEPKR